MLLKLADESCTGIWKLPKELSGPAGGGWNELKTDGGGWKGGSGGGINGPGPEGGSAGGDGGRKISLLFVGFCLSLNLFNQFLIAKSCPSAPGVCFIWSLAKTFFPTSSSLSKEPTIGFSASKEEISSKTGSKGLFCLKYSYL